MDIGLPHEGALKQGLGPCSSNSLSPLCVQSTFTLAMAGKTQINRGSHRHPDEEKSH